MSDEARTAGESRRRRGRATEIERRAKRLTICALASTCLVALMTIAPYGSAQGSSLPTPASGTTSCSAAALASRSYSPMYDDNTLQVFAGDNLQTIATVGGLRTPAEMVTSGDGRTLYVDDWGSGSLRVMNACTFQTIALIPVGGFSIATYISGSDGSLSSRYMYVSSLADEDVNVVDTWTNTIVRRYFVPGIAGVQLSPDGSRLYAVTAEGVFTFDPMTGQQLAPFLFTGALVPTWMTATPDGSRLYLADTGSDRISVVDAHTMKITKTIELPFGTTPITVSVTPDGKEVWVADGASSEGAVVISTVTDSVIKVIPTNGMALAITFNRTGSYAYIAEGGPNSDNAHLGALFLVLAALALVRGDGDIRIMNTTTLQQVGPVVATGQVPGNVSSAQPGVVSGG
jgi:YVTN family beta-propeller protein